MDGVRIKETKVNSKLRYADTSGGSWKAADTDSKNERHDQANKDSDLLIRHPAPDSSPSAVSPGTYSEGKICR